MKLKVVATLSMIALLSACASEKANNTAGTSTAAVTRPTGPVPGSEADLVATAGNRVFFAFDKSNLSDDAKATLQKQANWLAKYPNVNVQVAGNCDDRGTEEYNIALGQRRANAARDLLVAKGVAPSRISTISYGKDRPIALGDNEQAWAQNRNATTTVK
ncbi:MAG: peptidoglycan-associated lipoprotein Pal [Acetobacter sp.]|nr:peptidoglycan-associated lipoprotein Pal [Acetobacter sp.]MBR2125053.1 peptidoglycan-associated lipoprotein Pal [Acetobacter sp.]